MYFLQIYNTSTHSGHFFILIRALYELSKDELLSQVYRRLVIMSFHYMQDM